MAPAPPLQSQPESRSVPKRTQPDANQAKIAPCYLQSMRVDGPSGPFGERSQPGHGCRASWRPAGVQVPGNRMTSNDAQLRVEFESLARDYLDFPKRREFLRNDLGPMPSDRHYQRRALNWSRRPQAVNISVTVGSVTVGADFVDAGE